MRIFDADSMRLIDTNSVDINKTIGGQNDFADCIRDSVQAVLDNADTIQAIPLGKVKQAIEEIEDLPVEYSTLIDGEKVLSILYKLIESEGD